MADTLRRSTIRYVSATKESGGPELTNVQSMPVYHRCIAFNHTICYNSSSLFLLPNSRIRSRPYYTPQIGELNAAKVAGELNIPYCLSTAGSQPIEDVARANGNGPRFFQVRGVCFDGWNAGRWIILSVAVLPA